MSALTCSKNWVLPSQPVCLAVAFLNDVLASLLSLSFLIHFFDRAVYKIAGSKVTSGSVAKRPEVTWTATSASSHTLPRSPPRKTPFLVRSSCLSATVVRIDCSG